MATKVSKFKVGDLVRITNPHRISIADKGKIVQITRTDRQSVFPIEAVSTKRLQSNIFREDELSPLLKKELPLWQLKYPSLK